MMRVSSTVQAGGPAVTKSVIARKPRSSAHDPVVGLNPTSPRRAAGRRHRSRTGRSARAGSDYVWYAQDALQETPIPLERAAEIVTRIWHRALFDPGR
ncbi:hypothetical protein SAMN04490240_3414 [Rhodococcus pyridinivorans]|nr:hypothetical protein SAMN04490240_3414 [Rhodococcus pyridinivorans]